VYILSRCWAHKNHKHPEHRANIQELQPTIKNLEKQSADEEANIKGLINARERGKSPFFAIMHQSFPAVPIPPGQPRGICSNVISNIILSQPGDWALAYPRGDPRAFDTSFGINMEEFVGNDEDFVKDWLVHHGLEKLVDVFEGMFS